MNLINICDKENNLTSEEETVTEAHKKGLWHRSVHVWVYNSEKEILLQKRSRNSFLYPSMWDAAAAGHVDSGEEPISSAVREVREEIGMDIDKDDLQYYAMKTSSNVYNGFINNEFNYIYLLRYEGGLEKLKIQKEEVEEIGLFPLHLIEKDLNTENYVPHGDYWLKIIEEIKRRVDK